LFRLAEGLRGGCGGRSSLLVCADGAVRGTGGREVDNDLNHDGRRRDDHDHLGSGGWRVGGCPGDPAFGRGLLVVQVMHGVSSRLNSKRDEEARDRNDRRPSPTADRLAVHGTILPRPGFMRPQDSTLTLPRGFERFSHTSTCCAALRAFDVPTAADEKRG
jgi:hypothetical protein